MGKIKRGILGGFSGKVANIIGGSWKGIAYMRSLPLSVSNPRTTGQVAQRTSFSFGVMISKLILSTIIKPLWDRFAQGMSGYNAFMSANTQYFIDWTTTTWASIVTSVGKMAPTLFSIVGIADGTAFVNIGWDKTLIDAFQSLADISYAVAFNETNEEVGIGDFDISRNTEVLTINFPSNLTAGDKIHVYLAFRREDGSVVSDSFYVTGDVV